MNNLIGCLENGKTHVVKLDYTASDYSLEFVKHLEECGIHVVVIGPDVNFVDVRSSE